MEQSLGEPIVHEPRLEVYLLVGFGLLVVLRVPEARHLDVQHEGPLGTNSDTVRSGGDDLLKGRGEGDVGTVGDLRG
ncbi:MAG: hypothetical protein BAJATHORv1_30331 [Candidatus Thorarchaeota archaeon]|nr:MAG: hypothetical protein BAJATHORv1_30331 [Candidatus Thorarchaeota archaeon]